MKKKPSIAFLIGAGAEASYNMPKGAEFKKETILCENAVNFMKNFNKENGETDYLNNVTNGKFIRHNSTNVLYQSYKEISDEETRSEFLSCFNESEIEIIEEYNDYRCGIKENKDGNIARNFLELYKRKIYDPISTAQKESKSLDDGTASLLCYLSFYSSIDSDFNYLRLPKIYKKECCNVMKMYFSAYLSILRKILSHSYFNKIISKDYIIDKEELFTKYNDGIKSVIEKTKELTYYNVIKKYLSSIDTIITTNYTHIIDNVLCDKKKIIHIHGTMTDFEGLNSKSTYHLRKITNDEIVFPYILIQSGVKPIVNYKEIETFKRAFDGLKKSDIIIILGYSFSSDDEHIITFFKEIVRKKKYKIYYFNYFDERKEGSPSDNQIFNKLLSAFVDGGIVEVVNFKEVREFEEKLEHIINSN